MTDSEKSSPLSVLPCRNPESHKGDYGHVLLVGGSRGMSGAIALAGIAALRGGAGRVTVATADRCQDVVSSFEPSYMTAGLPAVDDGTISSAATEKILNLAEQATVVGCGPGIGRTDATFDVVAKLFEHLPKPTVFDADTLFALAARSECLRLAKHPRILTPHEGELARLVNQQGATRAEREQQAIDFATRYALIVVLKGHRTLVTDGSRIFHNRSGNAGMATGGSGDVLTGLITALLGQQLGAFEAAKLGVHLHGIAGDLAAASQGETSLIASDIVQALPAAFRQTQP